MEVIYTDDFQGLKNVVVEGIPGHKELSVGQTFAEKMGFSFEPEPYPEGEDAVFTDVEGQHYYSLPVLWAAYTGVTTGKTDTEFLPNETCTRGEMITFIWRFFGSPEPDYNQPNPFTDVASNRFYYKAILWGYQQGIINGITNTEFRPNETVTRAMAVTMLHRLDGAPAAAATGSSFTDAKVGSYYYNALLWGDETGVVRGYEDGTFRPGDPCTRGMIVTFLYRNLNEFYRYEDPYGNFVA